MVAREPNSAFWRAKSSVPISSDLLGREGKCHALIHGAVQVFQFINMKFLELSFGVFLGEYS